MEEFTPSFWIPRVFELEKLICEKAPVIGNRQKFKIDCLYFIINHILEKSISVDLDHNQGYIQIPSTFLQKFVGHDYRAYLTYLVENNIIYENKSYQHQDLNKGKEAKFKSYSLKFSWDQTIDLERIPVQDRVLRRKIIRELMGNQGNTKNTEKVTRILKKWFNPSLSIDIEGALNWIKNYEPFRPVTSAAKGTERGKAPNWIKKAKSELAVKKIDTQDFYISRDYKGGRVHTNLTTLKRELRNFITYKGESLFNIDLKNSQPFFSLLIFQSEFYNAENKINLWKLIKSNEILNEIKNNIPLKEIINIILVKNSFLTDFEDVKKYRSMVLSGNFYQQLHKELFPNNEKNFDKDEMKEAAFQILYSSNRFGKSDKLQYNPKKKVMVDGTKKLLFTKKFPIVDEVFRTYKNHDHSTLAVLLQKIESSIILDYIVPRISAERPDVPIFTIHDSIATTKENVKYVEGIMMEEIQNLTGLTPKFGIEEWKAKNEPQP